MGAVAAIVALLAILAISEEGSPQAASEREAPPTVDQSTATVDAALRPACDNTTVIYRDLSQHKTDYQAGSPVDATEGDK